MIKVCNCGKRKTIPAYRDARIIHFTCDNCLAKDPAKKLRWLLEGRAVSPRDGSGRRPGLKIRGQ